MGQRCTICSNKRRKLIDKAIVKGKSYQKIGNDYGVDAQAVRRHAESHLSHQLLTAMERKQELESLDLMNEIEDMVQKVKTIFDRNFDENKDSTALKALGEQRSIFELLCRILAYKDQKEERQLQQQELEEKNTISVVGTGYPDSDSTKKSKGKNSKSKKKKSINRSKKQSDSLPFAEENNEPDDLDEIDREEIDWSAIEKDVQAHEQSKQSKPRPKMHRTWPPQRQSESSTDDDPAHDPLAPKQIPSSSNSRYSADIKRKRLGMKIGERIAAKEGEPRLVGGD